MFNCTWPPAQPLDQIKTFSISHLKSCKHGSEWWVKAIRAGKMSEHGGVKCHQSYIDDFTQKAGTISLIFSLIPQHCPLN